MFDTLDQFTRKLTDSGLLSAKQLDAFRNGLPPDDRPQAAQQLCRQLIQNDLITEYQADALSDGHEPLVFGDYVILDKLGEGGMGVVFKAEHRRMKRKVALKLLPAEMIKDDSSVRRFEREVEIAAKLHHPNVVSALDAREENGKHYLVMEYVDGRDLSTVVEEEGVLPPERAADYIVQAAIGCQHAHQQGVVHRDIKPANLLLDQQGVIRILDMGLARAELPGTDQLGLTQPHLTGQGVIVGTIDFLSPEQALNSHHVDHRADIYSLGCTLYYLLVGRPVYAGETPMEKLVAHREEPIPTLGDSRPDIAPELDAVFQRMVAKRVDDRFQSMEEVAESLRASLEAPATGERAGSEKRASTIENQPEHPVAEQITEARPADNRDANAAELGERPAAARRRRPVRPHRHPFASHLLALSSRVGGAILGGFAGASIGSVAHWQGSLLAAVFYIWLGWRCGGGYAWTLAHWLGWSNALPETKAGPLFRLDNLGKHALVIVIGGLAGQLTGGTWRGVFLSLTVLLLYDHVRLKKNSGASMKDVQ